MLRRGARAGKRVLKRVIKRVLGPYLEDALTEPLRPPVEPPRAPVQGAPVDEDAAAEAELDAVVEQVIAEAQAAAKETTEHTGAAPQLREVLVFGEATPNPNAMKFTATVPIVPTGTLSFSSAEAAASHPLGSALFALDGVKVVFAINDFVTVTKRADVDWFALSPEIERVISEVLGAQT